MIQGQQSPKQCWRYPAPAVQVQLLQVDAGSHARQGEQEQDGNRGKGRKPQAEGSLELLELFEQYWQALLPAGAAHYTCQACSLPPQ